MINLYYNIYFGIFTSEEKTIDELLIDLENFNITKEELYKELEEEEETEANYYNILGISQHATEQEIKKAWRNAVKKEHPDIHKGVVTYDKIENINKTDRTLKETEKRNIYNEKINAKKTNSLLLKQKVYTEKDGEKMKALAIRKIKKIKEE